MKSRRWIKNSLVEELLLNFLLERFKSRGSINYGGI